MINITEAWQDAKTVLNSNYQCTQDFSEIIWILTSNLQNSWHRNIRCFINYSWYRTFVILIKLQTSHLENSWHKTTWCIIVLWWIIENHALPQSMTLPFSTSILECGVQCIWLQPKLFIHGLPIALRLRTSLVYNICYYSLTSTSKKIKVQQHKHVKIYK